jgi:toxin ParE1/3/4
MVYKIIVSPRAIKEIENAIDYYSKYNQSTPSFFINCVEQAYKTLEISPFFRVRYKNIRALPLQKFSYSLFYMIDEERKIIKILSCFHDKRNPTKNP